MAQSREINLIPYDVMILGRAQERMWMWAGIISLVIVVIFGLYLLEKEKIGAVEGAVAALSLRNLEMGKKLDQLSVLNDKRDRLASKEQVINNLLNKRSLSLLFAELERAMSSRVWLTSFDFTEGFLIPGGGKGRDSDIWVDTGYMIVKKDGSEGKKGSQDETPGVTAVLHGIAESNKDVAGFLERLSASVLISEVNLMFLREETIDKRSVVEFRIETYLKIM
jgi:Tfp pilus assembly protein PilN